MREIIITIGDDGSVKTEVKGVKGSSCKDLTKALELALGETKKSKTTSEYCEKPTQEQIRLGG